METKRRAANFTDHEENLLLGLVNEHKCILESKACNAKALQEKARCWDLIEKKFNTISQIFFRNKNVLKKKYDNLKKQAKKRQVEEMSPDGETNGDDGESEEKIIIEEINIEDIKDEPNDFSDIPTEEMQSEFDSDADGAYDDIIKKEETLLEKTASISATQHVGDVFNSRYGNYKPTVSQVVEQSNTLQSSSRKGKRKLDNETEMSKHTSPVSAFKKMKTNFLQEHNLRMKTMLENHEKQLYVMKRKTELKMELLQLEHKMKMELLRQEYIIKMQLLKLECDNDLA